MAIAPGNVVHGFVQCEAVRVVDLATREAAGAVERVGALDDDTLA